MTDLNLKFNPYEKEFQRIKKEIIELEETNKLFRDKIEDYQIINPNEVILKIENYNESEASIYQKLSNLKSQSTHLDEESRRLSESIKKTINPFVRWSKTQSSIRKNLEKINHNIESNEQLISNEISKLDRIKAHREKLQSILNNYKSFDFKGTKSKMAELDRRLTNKKNEFASVQKQWKEVDDTLNPILKTLREEINKKSTAESELIKAEDLQRRLDRTSPSQKSIRFHIHKEAEDIFGNGNPNQVINNCKKKISRSDRTIKKLEKRAYDIRKKITRNIEEIVIDGNNLAWKNKKMKKDFIGLEPVIKLSENLISNYKLTIIFDSDIRGLLKSDDNRIRKQFDQDVNVFIEPSMEKADQTILEYTSTKSNAYILSNDGFQEFVEHRELTNKRILRHALVDSQLMIHDLDINIKWRN